MKSDCQGGMRDVVVRFRPFLPKPPFRVFNLAGIFVSFSFFCLIHFLFSFFFFLLFFLFSFFLPGLCEVFFDYICIHRVRKVLAIHCCKHHGTAREHFLHNKGTFIRWSPLASWITLRKNDSFEYQVTWFIALGSHPLVKSFSHLLLVHLTMTNSRQTLFINEVQLIHP